jgi:membrane protease YdiL (CAAX protease family)
MQEFSEPAPSTIIQGPDLVGRIGKLFEVILVGIASSLVVPVFFAVYGISGLEILETASYLVTFILIEATLTLMIIWGILRINGERIVDLGWRLRNWRGEALIGLAFVPVLFVAMFVVSFSFRLLLPLYSTEVNPLLDLIKTRKDLLLFSLSSIYVGGFKEEIQRAFVLNRFGSHLGGMKIGLILWSLFFAYGHMMQGIDNAVGAGVLGLVFGLLYLWRRNLVAPIVAHAVYDIATLIIYWLFLRAL